MDGWNKNANFNDKRISKFGKKKPGAVYQKPIRSLADMARLNIAFLHQRIMATPYYALPFETDARDAPFLAELTEINQQLFVTTNGQPSSHKFGLAYRTGLPYEELQRPYLEGYLDRTLALRFLQFISGVPNVKFTCFDYSTLAYYTNFREVGIVVTKDREANTRQGLKDQQWRNFTTMWKNPARSMTEPWSLWSGTNGGSDVLYRESVHIQLAVTDWSGNTNLHQIVLQALHQSFLPAQPNSLVRTTKRVYSKEDVDRAFRELENVGESNGE